MDGIITVSNLALNFMPYNLLESKMKCQFNAAVRGLLPQTHCKPRITETVSRINQEQIMSCICPMFVNV